MRGFAMKKIGETGWVEKVYVNMIAISSKI